MRFGLQIPNFSYGIPESALFERIVEFARAAEDSGFDSVWVMDHLYQLPALGGPAQPMLESYTLLAAIGARTSRIHLGSLVSGVTYRNPALLAKIVTTLDVVTSGRAILGLGAAWYDVEHEAFGFPFPSDKERLDRLEEAVQICRAMLTEDAATFEGRHYRVRGLTNVPKPVHRIPIMIGGGGEKRTLRLVAQYADMSNFFGDADAIRHKISVLRAHCADVGRDPNEITVSRLATLVLTETEEEGDQIRKAVAQAAGEDVARARQIGTEEQIAEQVQEIVAAGAEYLIFNMPLSDPGGVARVGKLLSSLA